MVQLPTITLGAPPPQGLPPPRSPSPGPPGGRTMSMPLLGPGGSAVAPAVGYANGTVGGAGGEGGGGGMRYTTHAMAGPPPPAQASVGRALPPAPTSVHPSSQTSPHPPPYASPIQPYQQHPPPSDAAHVHAAALAAHHTSLVAYYWHYAQQGLVAPVQGGDEMQWRAREEAVRWARGLGIEVVDPMAGSGGTRAVAHGQQQQVPTPPTTISYTIPPTPSTRPTPHSAATAPPTTGRPLPTPSPAAGSSGRPLPVAPGAAGGRRPLPTPISTTSLPSSSTLSRSASLAHAPTSPSPSSPTLPLSRAATLPSLPPPSSSSRPPLPTPLPAPAPAPVGREGAKRPLPLPPTPEVLLQEKMAAMQVHEDEVVVPSMFFSAPDDEDAPTSSTPAFAFTLAGDEEDDDDEAPASKPAVPPSFSFDEPTASPAAVTPRLHPRLDPSHPSHHLYHPSSAAPSPSTAATGAVLCAGCDTMIFGRALLAMRGSWHPACFRCAEEGCGQLLEHVQFDGREGEGVFCMVHFEEHYAEKCYHCKTPIAESEYINIADPRLLPPTPLRTYHATHFFCAACGDPFVDPTSLARGKEHTLAKPYIVHKGYAYCQGCDLRVYKPKCVGCAQGIAGDFLETNEGSKWHEGCFCCVACHKPLSGTYLMHDAGPEGGGEQPYCGVCWDSRARE